MKELRAWDMVMGRVPKPQNPEEVLKWEKLNAKEASAIYNALSKDQKRHLQEYVSNVADMWRELGKIYIRQTTND